MTTDARHQGVILYGPPASGKDTITQALRRLDPRYELFPRLKFGPGRTAGYRVTTAQNLNDLRQAGLLLWENERYGATYAVDVDELRERLASSVPVLHLGQPEAVAAIVQGMSKTKWLKVELSVTRTIAQQRMRDRKDRNLTERMNAFDSTVMLSHRDLLIDTGITTPRQAAQKILAVCG